MRRGIFYICVSTVTFLSGLFIISLWLAKAPRPVCQSLAPIIADSEDSRLNLKEVFSDFIFVESRPINSWQDLVHGPRESLTFPEKFEAGREYIFHRRQPTDTDLLFEALENRFRSFGLDTNLSGNVLGMRLHPNYLFFRGKAFIGHIQMASHVQISKGGKLNYLPGIADYVLVLEREPLIARPAAQQRHAPDAQSTNLLSISFSARR